MIVVKKLVFLFTNALEKIVRPMPIAKWSAAILVYAFPSWAPVRFATSIPTASLDTVPLFFDAEARMA